MRARHPPDIASSVEADGSRAAQARRAGQSKIHVIMAGYVIHIPAPGEQGVNFTKIGIINNFA